MCSAVLDVVASVGGIRNEDKKQLGNNERDCTVSNDDDSLFISLADMSQDGVVIHINGEVVFANRAIAGFLNLDSGQELIGHTLFEYISAADQSMFDYRMQGVLVDQLRLPFYEYTLMCDGGGTIQIEMRGQPVRWNGQIASQVILRDLTAKYENEDAFRTLNRAVEQCPDSVIITDDRGVIEYVNPYFEERSGYSLDEIGARKTIFLLRGVMPRISYREMIQTVSEGRVWKGEFGIYAKSGERYWEQASVSPVLDKDQKVCHYICIMKDITVRKLAEENLKTALEKAEAANASKSAFLANMSHEFRTPLNAIIGFSSILASSPGKFTQGKEREYATYAKEAGDHLLLLVNDLLDLAKIEANQLMLKEQSFELSATVDNVMRLVAKKATENHCKLVADINKNFILNADNRRVTQILLNLVFNAIKFSEGGTVSVEATDPSSGKILIRDTGIGMSLEEIELALSPFGQAEGGCFTKKFDGAGLGLPIASNLMALHDGSLSIESTPSKGTTIILTFLKDRIPTC